MSSATNGVYHVTPEGTRYYESENGKAVEKQVDELAGVDAAVAHQAELNAHNPQPEAPGDIQLPAPSEPPALPAELTPHDSGSTAPPRVELQGRKAAKRRRLEPRRTGAAS